MSEVGELASILKAFVLKLDRFIEKAEEHNIETGKGLVIPQTELNKARQLRDAVVTYHSHEENYAYWCRRHRADEIVIYLVIAMFVFGGLALLILLFWWL